MASFSHEPSRLGHERRDWSKLVTRDMWVSLAIMVIWIVVFADALYGPNIVSSTPGGTSSSVPSAVVVALFAFFTSWVVAKNGFRDH
jgi:hypothetical protein